jgi:hypothetical protein
LQPIRRTNEIQNEKNLQREKRKRLKSPQGLKNKTRAAIVNLGSRPSKIPSRGEAVFITTALTQSAEVAALAPRRQTAPNPTTQPNGK